MMENIHLTLSLYKQEFYSEKSLYQKRSARRRLMRDPVLIDDPDDELSGRIKDEYKNLFNSTYSKAKVLEYVESMFRGSPVAFSGDLGIQNDQTYILSLLAVLHGNDRGIFYKPEYLDSIIEQGKYSIPEIRFERKKGT
jgi:hypothetical protein